MSQVRPLVLQKSILTNWYPVKLTSAPGFVFFRFLHASGKCLYGYGGQVYDRVCAKAARFGPKYNFVNDPEP